MKNSVNKQFIDAQVAGFSAVDEGNGELINKHHYVLEMILAHSTPKSYILDIGCSDGKILKELVSKKYAHLYGVDIQSKAANFFRHTPIHYHECDVEKESLPFHQKFDVIIMSDVLEHMFSPQTVLFDLKKYLKPHGKIIFSFPNAGWFLNGILLTFFPSKLFVSTAFGPWGHTYQFTFYQARKIATTLGYSVRVLKGGKLDNYAFKSGIKKICFDLFALATLPLVEIWPVVFSAHIFGVFENTKKNPKPQDRFDIGL